jgi:AraC-like DNA-binding protein
MFMCPRPVSPQEARKNIVQIDRELPKRLPKSQNHDLVQLPIEHPFIAKRVEYHSRLRRVVDHIQAHLTEGITLSDAARVACMERTAFCKFFSRTVKMSFRQFVQQWRVALAVELIQTSDQKLIAIAYAVGFGSMKSFDMTFKRLTGMTPSSYRKRALAQAGIDLAAERKIATVSEYAVALTRPELKIRKVLR